MPSLIIFAFGTDNFLRLSSDPSAFLVWTTDNTEFSVITANIIKLSVKCLN